MITRKLLLPLCTLWATCWSCNTADPEAGCYTPDGGGGSGETTTQWNEWTTSTYYPPPVTTTQWNEWSSYSYYTTSTPVETYYQSEGYVVTVTSWVPCPTSTVIYYTSQCPEDCPETTDECSEDCPAESTEYQPGGVTVTSYTTTTPYYPEETITSDGTVLIIMETSGYEGGSVATVTGAAQVINEGVSMEVKLGLSVLAASLVALVMIAL